MSSTMSVFSVLTNQIQSEGILSFYLIVRESAELPAYTIQNDGQLTQLIDSYNDVVA